MELLGFGGADGREDSDGSDEGGEGSKRRRRRDGGEQREDDGSPDEREGKRRRAGAEDGVDEDGVWGAMGGDDVDDLDAEDRIVRVRGLSGPCVCLICLPYMAALGVVTTVLCGCVGFRGRACACGRACLHYACACARAHVAPRARARFLVGARACAAALRRAWRGGRAQANGRYKFVTAVAAGFLPWRDVVRRRAWTTAFAPYTPNQCSD